MKIALIAHDKKKELMIKLCHEFRDVLMKHDLVATGTTGKLIKEQVNLDVTLMASGPLGGDQQIGALVSKEQLDMVIFLRDPLTAQPHEPDVSALLRLCDVFNIPLATNQRSAHIMLQAVKKGDL